MAVQGQLAEENGSTEKRKAPREISPPQSQQRKALRPSPGAGSIKQRVKPRVSGVKLKNTRPFACEHTAAYPLPGIAVNRTSAVSPRPSGVQEKGMVGVAQEERRGSKRRRRRRGRPTERMSSLPALSRPMTILPQPIRGAGALPHVKVFAERMAQVGLELWSQRGAYRYRIEHRLRKSLRRRHNVSWSRHMWKVFRDDIESCRKAVKQRFRKEAPWELTDEDLERNRALGKEGDTVDFSQYALPGWPLRLGALAAGALLVVLLVATV